MAPIFKTSLALLSVSAALLSSIDGVSAKKHNHNYGRHMKMAKRGSLFEDLSKRADELAPFGYDRCEWAFTHCPPILERASEGRRRAQRAGRSTRSSWM